MTDCSNIARIDDSKWYGPYRSTEYEKMSHQNKLAHSKELQKKYRYGVIDLHCRKTEALCPFGYKGVSKIKGSFVNQFGDKFGRCATTRHKVCRRVFPSENDLLTKIKCCAGVQDVDRPMECSPLHCQNSEACDSFMKNFCKTKLKATHPQWVKDQCDCINIPNKEKEYIMSSGKKVRISSACLCAGSEGYIPQEYQGTCAQTICIIDNTKVLNGNIRQNCKAIVHNGEVYDPSKINGHDFNPDTAETTPEPVKGEDVPQNWLKWIIIGGGSLVGLLMIVMVIVAATSKSNGRGRRRKKRQQIDY